MVSQNRFQTSGVGIKLWAGLKRNIIYGTNTANQNSIINFNTWERLSYPSKNLSKLLDQKESMKPVKVLWNVPNVKNAGYTP